MYTFVMFRMGVKFQTALIGAVYKKVGFLKVFVHKIQTLKLSNAARREKTIGEIVNLMAIDVEKFLMIAPQFHLFWSSPYQVSLERKKLRFNHFGGSTLTLEKQ